MMAAAKQKKNKVPRPESSKISTPQPGHPAGCRAEEEWVCHPPNHYPRIFVPPYPPACKPRDGWVT